MRNLSRPHSPAQTARARTQARQRIIKLQQKIAQLDYICPGTLLHRKKVCGRPGCRCATDPAARHGPYYEWGRLERGRLVHTQLTSQEGERFAQAIRNYRLLRRLLRRWTQESVRGILAESTDQR